MCTIIVKFSGKLVPSWWQKKENYVKGKSQKKKQQQPKNKQKNKKYTIKITNGTITRDPYGSMLTWTTVLSLNFKYETLLKYCKTLNSNIFDKT